MNLLILHPNLPGQFRLLAPALAREAGWRVVAVGQNGAEPVALPGVRCVTYGQLPFVPAPSYPPLDQLANHVRRGRAAAALLRQLAGQGFRPDVILAHPGWGDAMFVHDVFPDVPLVAYLEYYYRARGSDLDFDPEFPPAATDLELVRLRNVTNLMAAASAAATVTPTRWQAAQFPAALRAALTVQHEGVDTEVARPDPAARLSLPDGRKLPRGSEILTYVARGLEPYRGFHVFMRALPELQRRRPKLFTVIVGADETSYGRPPQGAPSWREALLAELGGSLDRSRVWFAGRLPYERYLAVLQASAVHVYLTYPFVLSWSLLEAMAAGCAVVASDTAPVTELVSPGETGELAGFFDRESLVSTLEALLADPARRARLGSAARAHIVENYDFRRHALPRYRALLEGCRA